MVIALPPSPAEITPDWLSEALDARVEAVEVLEAHAGTTGRARIGVTYAVGDSGPASVFVKLPPFDAAQRQMVEVTDMGRKEARFYAELSCELPVRIPQTLHASYGDSSSQYIMVLEDLFAIGCSFPKLSDPEALDHARQVVRGQARFHAHLWESPRFERELSWIRPPLRSEIGTRLVEKALAMFSAEMPAVFTELGRIYVDHHEAVSDLWEQGETTLVHGDCHMGNLFLDSGRIGFLDWAVVNRGPGMRDFAYYLTNSIETHLRRSEEKNLLELYGETLVQGGIQPPAFDALWRRYRLHCPYAWVSATVTAAMGDKWQPLQVGMDSMRRTTQAAQDLGSVDLFREELGL